VIVIAHIEKPVIPLFDRSQHHSSVPITLVPAVARSGGPGRPQDRCKRALPWMAASTMAGFRLLGVATSISALVTTVLPYEALADVKLTVPVTHSTSASRVEPFAAFIAEASRRFAIPEHWIRAVMEHESGTNERAVSPKGALGLMQIMPKTWVELSVRYGLGIDPFDPRDNILAGTAYLREMHDRFGSPGFLAAYNAGPERYEQHLATRRPLPEETQAYLAALTPVIDPEQQHGGSSVASRIVPWRQAPLFVEHLESTPVNGRSASALGFKSLSEVPSTARPPVLAPRADGLFVLRMNEMQPR
jgi:soluble lytic murein transglycosylase-like protein